MFEIDLRIPLDDRAPGVARHTLDGLSGWVADEDLERFQLAVSELVTNAIVHGRSRFTVTMTRKRAAVRIEVTDPCPRRPVLTVGDAQAMHGRGLQLVERLSSDWSSYIADDGRKVVWGEVRAPITPEDHQPPSAHLGGRDTFPGSL